MKSPTISIVVSVYNEAEGLTAFWTALKKSLSECVDFNFEILWINDGSVDESQSIIQSICAGPTPENSGHVQIEFSKNFGHEAAMLAGMDTASGEAILCMDADQQHPPSSITEMLHAYRSGADIVLMQRTSRRDASVLHRFFSTLFYRLINALSSFRFQSNATDFFLVSYRVAEVLRKSFRERNRFLRGFIQSLGFEKKVLYFEAPARAYGESHYSYYRLTKLALNAIFTFSNKPLRLSILIAVLFVLFTLAFGAYSIYQYLFGNTPPSGYTSIILFLSVSFSLLFILLTIFFLYFEKVLDEMRQRPIYIIKNLKRS
ncbi:MAG: glycosyltransferase family 2 protein [Chitinophagaceae bacterium]|nr:glycosyltransferase family 2 protein [Chitinophagaceae bacterium]